MSAAADAPASTEGVRRFDRALELLYDDGTAREGSLRFLEHALKYEAGTD